MTARHVGASYTDFASVMAPAVWKAARIARILEGRVPNEPKDGETTAVKQALTVADPAAQEQVLAHLLLHYPEVSLEAEEDSPTVVAFGTGSEAVVIIDPIDGTLHSYLEGGGPYAVIVGLALDRAYAAGVVALPREGLLVRSDPAAGAVLERSSGLVRPARPNAAGRRILVSHSMPDAVGAWLCEQGYEVISSCGGAVSVAPLIPGVVGGVRFASGEGGVSIRGRVGALISRGAGACVVGDGGKDFPSDMDTPSHTLRVAANGDVIDLLGRALAAGGVG